MQIILANGRGFCANTYILTIDGTNAIVIDPGHTGVLDELNRRGLTCCYVLLTHCHYDHVCGVPALQNAGAKVVCSELERPLVGTRADLYDLFGAPRTSYQVDETFSDGDVLSLCGISITAYITPGHTAGGACYLVEMDGKKVLFTGDTLFAGTIGRTDFPTGDLAVLRNSLMRLAKMEGDYVILPGHEEETSMQTERERNPFLRVV